MDSRVITCDPRMRWGTPCLRETGITVGSVVALHRAGYSTVRILDAVPELRADDVDAALEWFERFGDDGLGPEPPPPGPRHPHVAVDRAVQGGQPVIRGTRITVDAVCGLAAEGWTPAEIIEEYPELTSHDVRDALDYDAEARLA